MTEYQRSVERIAEQLLDEIRGDFEGCTVAELVLQLHELVFEDEDAEQLHADCPHKGTSKLA